MIRAQEFGRMQDPALLACRFDALDLRLGARAPLSARIRRLGAELGQQGIRFRPHCWLSSDFFTPDGVPGMALPFYLAHPRLMRLERAQRLHCEGQNKRECMQLLRHETGHAIDNAYELHKRGEWRRLFGLRSAPYRRIYGVHPAGQDHVRYLPNWYAQSHPAEDFAETFAVWLDTGSRWKQRYRAGPARAKLEWVAQVMAEIGSQAPRLSSREQTERIQSSKQTLGEHYLAQGRRLRREPIALFEEPLQAAFRSVGAPLQSSTAAAYIRRHQKQIQLKLSAKWRGNSYALEQVIAAMGQRCRQLGLQHSKHERGPTPGKMANWVQLTLGALESGSAQLAR